MEGPVKRPAVSPVPEAKRLKTGSQTRQGGRRGTRSAGEAAAGSGQPRLPKRQCALLVGFCGTGCSGMQIQRGVRTIEGVLFGALVRAGAVSQDNADDPVKVGLKRAARTDAGVHAAGNVVSLKLITRVPGVADLVARINGELPREVRVWGCVRTRNAFNAHTFCDSRMYTYFLPSYVLLPPKPGSGLARALAREAGAGAGAGEAAPSGHPFWAGADDAAATAAAEDDLVRKRAWRIGGALHGALRVAAAKYVGTHNFHNFTVGREFADRSCQRFIKRLEVQDPVVYGDTEWIAVLFHGQSFMLHQRKMVCALVLACRTGTPPSIIGEMFGPLKVAIPKAPALGLLLEQPLFESYNQKMSEANALIPDGDHTDANFRPAIDFEPHRALIEQFKQEQIYSRMRAQEDEAATFDAWIRAIDAYAGDDLLYLNPKGVIPPGAVLTGQPRPNPFRERRIFDVAGPVGPDDALDQDDEARVDADADAEEGREGGGCSSS